MTFAIIRQSLGLYNVGVSYRVRREKFLLKAKRPSHSLLQALCIDSILILISLSCLEVCVLYFLYA